MSKIEVDLREIRSLNQNLRSIEEQVDGAKRGVSRLSRQIPGQISERHQIRDRLHAVCSQIERLEAQLDELYDVTRSCVEQYAETENENSRNANAFD